MKYDIHFKTLSHVKFNNTTQLLVRLNENKHTSTHLHDGLY